jgi:hypothetical protein
VCRPKERSKESTIRAVDVLPFVPVMWIAGAERCGSPSNSTSIVIRSRVGAMIDSGTRASSSAAAAAKPISSGRVDPAEPAASATDGECTRLP